MLRSLSTLLLNTERHFSHHINPLLPSVIFLNQQKTLCFKPTLSFSESKLFSVPNLPSLRTISTSPRAAYANFVAAGVQNMRRSDIKAAHQFFQKAFKLSISLFGEKSKNTAICLNYLAKVCQLEGNIKNSLKFNNEALDILANDSDLNSVLASDIHHDINMAYQRVENFTKALEHAEIALQFLTKYAPDDKKRISLILQSIGKIYTSMGDIDRSKAFLFKSLDILLQDQNDNAPELTLLYDKIATLCEKEGNITEAIGYREKAVEVNNSQDIKYGLFKQCTNLAALYDRVKKPEESLQWLNKALESLEEESNAEEVVHKGPLLVKMGQTYYKTGKTGKAVECLEEALKVLGEVNLTGDKIVENAKKMLRYAKYRMAQEEKGKINSMKQEVSDIEIKTKKI